MKTQDPPIETVTPAIAVKYPPTSGITLLEVINVLLAHWRVIVILPIFMGLFAGVKSLLQTRNYVATSTLAAVGAEPPSRLSGLAAQFGVGSLTAGGTAGPEFFRAVLVSRDVLRDVATTHYRVRTGPGAADTLAGTYMDLAEIEGDTPNQRLLRAIQRLEATISAIAGLETGIITLAVRTEWPDLSLQINRRIIELSEANNIERGRAQATARRLFAENQARQARASLESAESALREFLEGNRSFASSPTLVFQQQRLQRRVDLEQQLYVSLAAAAAEAKLDELRDLPSLSVITPPETIIEPQRRGTVARAFLGAVTGLVLAILYAFTRESLERMRASRNRHYLAFESQLRSIRAELGRFAKLRRS